MESSTRWPIPTLADVFKARRAIAPYLRATPSLEPAELAAALGCRAVLKCENLNPTGAFKVRGGVNLLAALAPSERAQGVVAASTGNHGQSVAYAARLFGCRATIFMPEAANPLKVAATKALWERRSFRPAVISMRRGLRPKSMLMRLGYAIRALVE